VDWYVDTTQIEAFSEVKAEVTAYLHRHALDREPIADAQVIVSELMANAMRHATGPAWVSVTWSRSPRSASCWSTTGAPSATSSDGRPRSAA
jgi:anti-sigma regulatory factor (Ser/Thr protein kinase)